MCKCREYSGWSSYETWLVNLWLNNDEWSYYALARCENEKEVEELVDNIMGEIDRSGLLWDLVSSALSSVDFREIFEDNRPE
jgi:hypothetical protein